MLSSPNHCCSPTDILRRSDMTMATKVGSIILGVEICSVVLGGCVKKGKDEGKKSPGAETMRPASMSVAAGAAMGAAMGMDMEAAMTAPRPAAMPAPMVSGPGGMASKGPLKAKGGAYPIKFDRPLKVGMQFKVVALGSHRIERRVSGKIDASRSFAYSFAYQGVETIKALGSGGQASWVEHKVGLLTITMKGKTLTLLQPGALLDARVKGQDLTFQVGGRLASRKVMAIVRDVVDLRGEGAISTDAVFGPGVPKKPGDTWQTNGVKLLADLKKALKGAALWPKLSDVTGQVSLVGPQKMNGMEVVLIKALVKVNNIAPNMGPLKVTGGTMKIGVSGWLPQDVQAVGGAMQMRMTIEVKGQVSRGGKTHVETHAIQRNKKVTRTLLPTGGAIASTQGGSMGAADGGAPRVDCKKMCARTFKTCLVETLVTSGKLTRKMIDKLKKSAGAMAKIQQAGYNACQKDCARKKGFGTDAAEINTCLALASCAKYAQCIKRHVR